MLNRIFAVVFSICVFNATEADSEEPITLTENLEFYEESYSGKTPRKGEIYYFEKNGNITIMWNTRTHQQNIKMVRYEVENLLGYIEKYLEWEKIAVENKVDDMQKKIGEISMICGWAGRRISYDWKVCKAEFFFFVPNQWSHQMAIRFPEIKDSNGTSLFGIWYMSKDHVLALKKYLSDEHIKKRVKEHKEKPSTSDLFR